MALRTGYNRDRAHGAFSAHQELLARVMEDIRETGNSESELHRLLTLHGGDSPAGMVPKDAFRALLSRGLIQRRSGTAADRYACPIPSLVSYCAAGTGNPLHREVMAGNGAEVAALLRDGFDPNGRDNRGRTPAEVQRCDPILALVRPLPTPAAPKPKPAPVDDGPDFGM